MTRKEVLEALINDNGSCHRRDCMGCMIDNLCDEWSKIEKLTVIKKLFIIKYGTITII